jgi:hypothetical protein
MFAYVNPRGVDPKKELITFKNCSVVLAGNEVSNDQTKSN